MHVRILAFSFAAALSAQTFRPEIPKFWDDEAVEKFELPLASRENSPRHLTSKEYYALKVRPIYKTYPVYAPGREPAGYIEWLKQQEPEIAFDPAKLKTKEDWIAAGKLVFEHEPLLFPAPKEGVFFKTPLPPAKDGTLPYFIPGNRYVIRKKGVLEVGINACAGCHTRVMPDGAYLPGAQGMVDFPNDEATLASFRNRSDERDQRNRETLWMLFGTPWLETKDQFFARLTKDELFRIQAIEHSGVLARQGTSATHPPHIPSLIGVQNHKYLDSTGFARHRSIGDLARYAITNQGLDTLAHFGGFQPSDKATPFSGEIGTRYSDEQLYALALYIYSLEHPKNPNTPNSLSQRGQRIFNQQGCATCHAPPFYTSNKLTPAKGFKVPDDLRKTDDILDAAVGTDTTLALKSRRGTGFYKIPALRGVWYRNAFGHGGWVDTLEEWFDPERIKPAYQPKGYWLPKGPIEGHEFGLKLSPEDRQALIAFLKTL